MSAAVASSVAADPARVAALAARFGAPPGAAPPPRTVFYGSHESQFYRVHLPAEGGSAGGPLKTLVVVHGGFWKTKYTVFAAAHETIAPAVVGLGGWAAIEVEYRRCGEAGGGWPGSAEDVAAALDHALAGEPRADAARVVLLGHSAGGHGALFAAADAAAPVALVVAVAPVADLVACHERGLSDDGDAAATYVGGAPVDAQRLAAACPTRSALPRALGRCDLLVATGGDDADVPPDLSRALYATAAAAAPPDRAVALLEIPGADHYDVTNAAHAAFAELWATVEALLGGTAQPAGGPAAG